MTKSTKRKVGALLVITVVWFSWLTFYRSDVHTYRSTGLSHKI